MSLHLVLRLEAPLASAGTVAGENTRPTAAAPTRSMVLGLLGNALGLDRTCAADMRRLDRLQDGTWFSTVVLEEPGRWIDIQNNRVPTKRLEATHDTPGRLPHADDVSERLKAGGRISDHPLAYGIGPDNEVERVRKLLHEDSRQRSKQYLTGLRAFAAISPADDWPEPPHCLATALQQPARALWIGRKSCSPSAPVCLRQPLIEAASGPEALLLASSSDAAHEHDAANTTAGPATLWWEAAPQPGSDAASRLGISGGFATVVTDRRDWVLGRHTGGSTMWRGAIALLNSRGDLHA